MTVISAITVAAPTFARGVRPEIKFASPLFFTAMACAIVASVCGLAGRLHGQIVLPDPDIIVKKQLGWTPWQFKKNALYHAAANVQINAASIARKREFAVWATVFLLLETVAFVTWLAW